MASEETEPLEQFNQSYNTLNPTNALSKNTLTQYIDGRIPDSNGTTEQIGTGRIDAFANKNTFSAIVVNVPPAGSPPYAGTSAEGLYKKGVITLDNFTQCLVYILGAHDDVLELPTDLSPQALSSEGEQQKYFKLATVATTFGKLNEPVVPGSIVTVEPINDTGRPESRIVNVVKTNPKSPAAALQNGKDAFDNINEGLSNLDSSTKDTTGDGTPIDNTEISSEIGDCGGIKSRLTGVYYEKTPCLTKKLDATGQTITAHPKFWEQINSLLNKIKQDYPDFGSSIRIGEAVRSQQKQYQYRLNRCPTFKTTNCVTEEQFKTLPWGEIVAKCKCKDATATAAVYGPNASNHLLGLAVDLNLQLPNKMSCADKKINLSAWAKCREQSKVFKILNLYAKSFNIFNLEREPWHWSHNGG